jgi:superfamily I DNA/RNA helicase
MKKVGNIVCSMVKNIKADSISYELTDEQKQCVETARQGKDIKIKAFAGSGKTSTLVAISRELSGKGLYLAYNKAIQTDAARKFPLHVDCKTAHSIAYRVLAYRIKDRVRTLSIFDITRYVDIKRICCYEENDIAYLTLKLLRVFINSDRNKIDHQFRLSKVFEEVAGNNGEETRAIINYVIDRAAEYWQACAERGSTLPIEHDFYLKMYQLSNPDLSSVYDFILFDECQDANPVLLDILLKQKCQKIYVGDEHQQIYSWRGSINSFAKLGGEVCYLSRSFRFGNEISRLANIIITAKNETQILCGSASIETKVTGNKLTAPFTILCRTNARIIEKILAFQKQKLHVVGGVNEILNLAKSGYALFTGNKDRVSHSKLKYFKSWDAMLRFNHKYQDPDITFLAKLIKEHGASFKNIIKQIENACYVGENEAAVTLSTIHKSKGREWDNVVLEDDFIIFTNEVPLEEILVYDVEELNLIYVGVTRTKGNLLLASGVSSFLKRLEGFTAKRINLIIDAELKNSAEVYQFPNRQIAAI